MEEYRDPIIQKLIDTFEAEGHATLSGRYIHGDALRVPREELPVVTISKDNTRIVPASNVEDGQSMPMVVNVIYDYLQDLTQSSDLGVGITSLYRLCEGRSDTDYTLLPDTLAYILRKYPKLDTDLFISVGPEEALDINYGLGIERRGPGIFSVEAVIRFNVQFIQVRPSA